jgi:hypothetical protein
MDRGVGGTTSIQASMFLFTGGFCELRWSKRLKLFIETMNRCDAFWSAAKLDHDAGNLAGLTALRPAATAMLADMLRDTPRTTIRARSSHC